MRILLVADYAPDSLESMQRYSALLAEGLTKAGHHVRVCRPNRIAGKLAIGQSGKKWLGYMDKFIFFPWVLKRATQWPEIIHICNHANSIYVKYICSKPHLVTCHDLLAIRSALGEIPGNATRWTGRRLQHMIFNGLIRAKNIVCVSNATLDDLKRLVPSEENHQAQVCSGLNFPYSPMKKTEASRRLVNLGINPSNIFVLHVGGNQWYKNRLGTIRIFARVLARQQVRKLLLVMAGKPWTHEMRALARSLNIESSCVELTNVSNEDLRALYSRAEALLFPSLAEGFGWPIAEAQACGCPVVTSGRPPMTEVGGDAATYIDPCNHEEAAAAVASVIGSRDATREANLKNAARFGSAAMIDRYLVLYSQILDREASKTFK